MLSARPILPALAVTAASALALTACDPGQTLGTDPVGTPDPIDPRSETSVDEPEAGVWQSAVATTSPVSSGVELVDACTLQIGTADVTQAELAHPEGWATNDECRFFDPDMDDVPEDSEPGTVISWNISDIAFSRASEPSTATDESSRHLATRAGLQAVRIEGVSTGDGLRPAGEQVVTWVFDLDAGADDTGGVLIGSSSLEPGDDTGAHAVLDAMADRVVFERTEGLATDDIIVGRTDGAATSAVVTWDNRCFELRTSLDGEVLDEACDAPVDDGALVLTRLRHQDLVWAVGHTRFDVSSVVVDDGRFGARTTSVEGGGIVAVPIDTGPTTLTARAGTTDVATLDV